MARRFSALVLAGAVGALGGGCSSNDCSSYNCLNQLTVTATVPPIDGQTWTVHACVDAACDDATLDASDTDVSPSGYTRVSLLSAGSGWQLAATFEVPGSPSSGDTWSVRVVNGAGSVITQGGGPVDWQTYQADSCHRCTSAMAKIP